MSAFDDLTLGEVDDMMKECLKGKDFTECDPLQLAGAVMFYTQKRSGLTDLPWDDWRYRTSMGDIRKFSETEMGDGETDPTVPPELTTP